MQTITFKLLDKTQFKCNGLFYWFEILWNITIWFLLFFICDVWSLQLLINKPVFYYNICVFSAERWFGYNIPIKLIILSLRRIHWKLKLWIVWLRNFESSNLTFRCQLGSKICLLFESPYYNFLSNFYRHFISRSVLRRSTSKSSVETFSLSRTVFEIIDFKDFRDRPWPLTFRGFLRSKLFSPFESLYMISYLTSINPSPLSRIVFEIFDFSRANRRILARFQPMLFQCKFSRSTWLVSQTCGLVSYPTWLGWLFGVVLITPYAAIWVFTTPYQCIFPYAISGMNILSGV